MRESDLHNLEKEHSWQWNALTGVGLLSTGNKHGLK